MATELDVWRAEKEDADAVTTALRAGAPDEAVTEWIMRGYPADRFLDVYLPEIVQRGLADDEIWVAGVPGEIWAVSVWQAVDSAERLHAEAANAREHADRARDVRPLQRSAYVTDLLAREHPRRFPHRYLELIVTVPQYRGRGAGAAILGNRTRALAGAGMPAYLEASTERSSRLYARHGFVRTGAAFTLPEDGPTLLPMWFEA